MAALEPVEEIEKDLLKQMARLDRLAAAPGGAEILISALAEEFQTTAHEVSALTQPFSLRPGEVAVVLALTAETGKSAQNLLAELQEAQSWPEVARDNGVSLATLMRRLRAVERIARQLMERAG